MLFNYIKTNIPCVYIVEEIDGYKVIEYWGDNIEVLAKTQTLTAAREYVNRMY